MEWFSHLFGNLETWVHDYGVIVVFVILTFESFGLPLPGESMLVTAAILSGRGDMSFWSLFVAGWCGAVLGDNIGYLIGRKLGRTLLRSHGRKIGLTEERLGKVEAAFVRYGPATVGFARFINVLRQLNGVVAGTLGMDWRRFLLFNALGGAAWVLVWTSVGFYVGSHGADIVKVVHSVGFLVVIVALVAVAAFLAYRHRAAILATFKRPVNRAQIDREGDGT
jgi:membrane protein DedA with SNARE-associated domain